MMKSRRAVLGAGATGAAAAAIGAFTATPAHALTRPMERDHRSLPSEIRVLMQRLVDRRLVPGLQLAAMRDGRLTLSSSIGRTNLETGSEATNLSIFRIGSVTKQFTAASILRLRALGKISLDDRLKKFFPDLPNAENVSILQMLSHTSGLGNYTDAATRTIFLERARTDYDQAELYAAMKATSPLFLFEPGTHWAYSNTAYVLLGIVVEKITGLPLRKAYRELVLDRAGLKHTDTDDAAEVVPGRASGYTPNAAAAQGFDNSSFVAMSYPGGAGILRSTAEDLCAWHEALFGGRVLASADVVEMTTPARLANGSVAEVPVGPGSPVDYGLGLRLTRQNGRKVVYHGGGIQGFLSKLTTFPESRSTFAWITNTDGGFEPSAQQELSDTLDKLETTLGTMLGVQFRARSSAPFFHGALDVSRRDPADVTLAESGAIRRQATSIGLQDQSRNTYGSGMSDVLSRELPAPKRWQELESLAFDVFSRIWKTTDAELHGRTGQPQAGVDVYGTNRVEGLFTGVQCKGKDADYGGALTEAELREEVAKARTFQPPLEAYVVLTTAPNDAAIQKVAREIGVEHRRMGLFDVRVMGWDTFRHHIAGQPDLLVKYFRDFAPIDVLAQLEASGREAAQGFAGLHSVLRTTNRIMADIRDDRSGSDDLAARVTEVSRLIGDGSPRAALKALDRMTVEEGESASPLARYRLLASKGNAHFALGEEGTALELFRSAYEAYPEFPNARTTLAIVHLLQGDRAKAFELAASSLEEDPTSARTAGVVLDSAPVGMTLADVERLIAPELIADPEIKLHLTMRAHELGDHDSQRRLAEEALAAAPNDWRMLAAVAEALMQPLSGTDGVRLTHAIPEAQEADVARAADLLRRSWSLLVRRDSSYQGRHVAANLITVLGLLGRDAEADTVLDQALAHSPTYDPLAYRSAQRAAAGGDWHAASRTLDSIPEDEETLDTLLLKTQAGLELADHPAASSALERLRRKSASLGPMPEREQLVDALAAKVEILGGADRDETIDRAVRSEPGAIVLRSVLFDDLPSDGPMRARLIGEVSDLAKGDLSLQERLHAAETLFAARAYSLAADLYATLHAKTDSHALRRRLHALYLADRRADARKLYETLSTDLRASPGYLNIGVNIYERAGLLKPALALLEKAIAREDALHTRLAWMQMLVRLGRRDRIIDWLRAVPTDIDGTPGELMSLARVIDQYLGRDPKALAIGYRALRAGYGEPEIHLGYALGLVINGRPDDDAMASPETVVAGSGVVLVDETTGDVIYRVIEEGADPVIERGELRPTDAFAKLLIGLRTGDQVDVPKIGTGGGTYRIEEIQSGYLFAFRRTLRDFNSLFPQNAAFGSFEIDESKGDSKFDEVFALARRRAEAGREIETIYRDNIAPLPMMAKFTGSSVFDLWDAFSRQPSLGLKSALGVVGEFESGRRAAGLGVAVVDPVSIYAWARMGLGGIIRKSLGRLGVVQSTIDLLRQLVEEREAQRGRRMGTFGWDGERYHIIELSEDEIEVQVGHAADALALAEAITLVPAETERVLPDHLLDFLKDLHPAYHDTLIAGLRPERSVLTDDLGFRAVVQEAEGAVTWTQPFAQAAHARSETSHPEYREVLAALVSANYRFTQFGHADLLGELQESGWTISARLAEYAKLMTSETIDAASVANVFANLWIESRPQAPDDAKFAAFFSEYSKLMRDAGRAEALDRILQGSLRWARVIIARAVNRARLPARLMNSTHHTPPALLAEDFWALATRRVEDLERALRKDRTPSALQR